MKRTFSRRDFLKVAGVGLGAMAFRPFKPFDLEPFYTPKRLPQFPDSKIIGRLVDATDIRSRPSNDPLLNTSIGTLPADTLIPWEREVIGNVVELVNQKYLETPQGYIWSSRVQPTRNIPNTPITAMPEGKAGFWAEVTVPYVEMTLESAPISPWIQSLIQYAFPPRVYYGQVIWIDQVRQNNGFVEYRWNESPGHGYGFGDIFWMDGAGLKVLTEEDVAPINPDIDPAEKRIVADLTYQTLSCFEGNNEVYFCRISSGAKYDPLTGAISEERATPTGDLNTHWKIISLNMSGGGSQSGYSTPAVPWDTVIHGDGIAIHGAFWHNDFGERRSHGCINVKPEDAKWIFRWTTPYISLAQCEQRMVWPDHGTVVSVTEKVV
ncbi:MAG: L,D-transpeptidase family protein [Chloroflexi bacterium]|nr:L,D-transpeptidase family protein [Chloroflexota bacterium]